MKCPNCGEEMEEGTLRASAVDEGPTNVLWGPLEWRFWRSKEKKIEKLGFGFTHVDLKGFRCTNCKIVVFSYEKQ